MLRAIDLDTTRPVWIFRPASHKTAHHGKDRHIYLGPQAQAILSPFMAHRPLDAYLLSPREGRAERQAEGAHCRRRPNQKENPRKTDRMVGNHYTTGSYRRAIQRACDIAGIDRWSPHQLRHNAATAIRKKFGLEAAQLLLGHAKADVTQMYAEVNQAKAVEVAGKLG